jgi:hypothetical protein
VIHLVCGDSVVILFSSDLSERADARRLMLGIQLFTTPFTEERGWRAATTVWRQLRARLEADSVDVLEMVMVLPPPFRPTSGEPDHFYVARQFLRSHWELLTYGGAGAQRFSSRVALDTSTVSASCRH